MTDLKRRPIAPTGSACPKKVTELFYVTHPKAPKALLGPFLSQADAECGRVVMRSADAVVTACLIDSLDDLTYWHAVNNGEVVRALSPGPIRRKDRGPMISAAGSPTKRGANSEL